MDVSVDTPAPCRIERIRRETADTFTVTCESRRAPFAPGQFDMLYAFGTGEVPISISGDPSIASKRTYTIRAVGNVTGALRRLRRGDAIGVRGPFGRGWPMPEGRDLVLVAGGIGLAPLRPVITSVLANRDRFGRLWVLYGARTPADMLYARELARWRGRLDATVLVTVDRADRDWRGRVGVVTALFGAVALEPARAVAMICGPEIMMRFTARELLQRGVAAESIHVSLERNMKCAVGFCGHCQYGPAFICKDGPVFRYDRVADLMRVREL